MPASDETKDHMVALFYDCLPLANNATAKGEIMMKRTIQGSLLLSASLTTLLAQTALPARSAYAAKFVCGVSNIPTQNPPSEPAVKRGNYATIVNIHNPNNRDVVVQKRISLGAPERYQSTPPTTLIAPTKRVIDILPSDYTMYVDCAEIVNLLKHNGTMFSGTFIEGYVLMESYYVTSFNPLTDAELDVVTVTTTAQLTSTAGGGDNGVNSHEVTPVTARKLAAGTWPN